MAPGRPAAGRRLRTDNSNALPLVVMSPLGWSPAIRYLCHFRRSPLIAPLVVDFCRAGAVSGFSGVMLVTLTFGGL